MHFKIHWTESVIIEQCIQFVFTVFYINFIISLSTPILNVLLVHQHYYTQLFLQYISGIKIVQEIISYILHKAFRGIHNRLHRACKPVQYSTSVFLLICHATVTCFSLKSLKSCARMCHYKDRSLTSSEQIVSLLFLFRSITWFLLLSPIIWVSKSLSFSFLSLLSDMSTSNNGSKSPVDIDHRTLIPLFELF